MKPAAIVVADEMFPEGVGPYMEIEEVIFELGILSNATIISVDTDHYAAFYAVRFHANGR